MAAPEGEEADAGTVRQESDSAAGNSRATRYMPVGIAIAARAGHPHSCYQVCRIHPCVSMHYSPFLISKRSVSVGQHKACRLGQISWL